MIRNDFGLSYINCGDWVESCTAVVEHFDGRMEIIHWPYILATPSLAPDRLVPVAIDGGLADRRSVEAA